MGTRERADEEERGRRLHLRRRREEEEGGVDGERGGLDRGRRRRRGRGRLGGREREVVGLLWAWMGFGWEGVGLFMGLYGPGTFGMDHCEGSYFFSFFLLLVTRHIPTRSVKKKRRRQLPVMSFPEVGFLMG